MALHSFTKNYVAGKKKPYKDKDGKENEEERHVMSQPLMYGNTYNHRKLNNLPYHLIHSKNVAALKEKCLCNYEFLQHKLLATSCRYERILFFLRYLIETGSVYVLRFSIMSLSFYREVIDDFDLARRTFPNEKVLDLIGEACQLSEDDVIYDPLMFPSQMIDRLMNEKVMVVFI